MKEENCFSPRDGKSDIVSLTIRVFFFLIKLIVSQQHYKLVFKYPIQCFWFATVVLKEGYREKSGSTKN